MDIVLGIILLVLAAFLVFAIMMQDSKSHKLSGTIAGGAETFFGKSKGKSMNKTLSMLTTIAAIAFTVVVIISYLVIK